MTSVLLQNAHIVDPVTGRDGVTNILIEDGTISSIGDPSTPSSVQTFDLKEAIVAPGFCDMHVHLREPGYEHKETIATGTAAAAAGGFTAVACMPNTDPPIDSAEVIRSILDRASGFAVDVLPVATITRKREGEELAPLAELADAGAVAFSDDGAPVVNSQLMRIAFEYALMFNKPLIQHAEDLALANNGCVHEGTVSARTGLPPIPSVSETVMVARDLLLAEYTGGLYHVSHVSTAGAVELIREAKKRGVRVTAEATPHHFTLTDEATAGFDTNTKMKPPLRNRDDLEAIKEGLRDGTIDAIATDHAPHAPHEKLVEYTYAPFGIIGLETAVGLTLRELVLPGVLTLVEAVEKLSTNPRRILGLREIRLEPGEPANLTLFDMNRQWTFDVATSRSKSRNTPFHGESFPGKIIGIFNRTHFIRQIT